MIVYCNNNICRHSINGQCVANIVRLAHGTGPYALTCESVSFRESINNRCPDCWTPIQHEGGCQVCPNCGWSKCS